MEVSLEALEVSLEDVKKSHKTIVIGEFNGPIRTYKTDTIEHEGNSVTDAGAPVQDSSAEGANKSTRQYRQRVEFYAVAIVNDTCGIHPQHGESGIRCGKGKGGRD
ncbi:hypothetical protein O1611_g6630 [Lasiodiplodia mahajangana]|uniref:Uncharacterized protein n=1 Tax=Lasiodiplodia mahajangana TaxID=1108764 RepID=A0ACC2JHU4_9PEZI|nr:hypothetical protein O1611_g6630 [Lasiodiplodia mahajangana]